MTGLQGRVGSNVFQMLVVLKHWLVGKVLWQRDNQLPVCDEIYLTSFSPSR